MSLLPFMHSLLQQTLVLAMVSPSPPSFCNLFYCMVRRLFVLCAAPPAVRNRGAADAFLPARRDERNEGILEVSGTCSSGLQEIAEEGELCPVTRSVCLQLDTGFRPLDDPCFILDSGAACHVAGDRSLFSSSSFRTVTAPTGSTADYQARDGRRLDVTGVGTISCNKIHLPNVLCVPALSPGVIRVSVQQLADRDYLVMFGGGLCYVRERSSGELVGMGRLHDTDGLYHLEFLSIPPDNPDATDTPA